MSFSVKHGAAAVIATALLAAPPALAQSTQPHATHQMTAAEAAAQVRQTTVEFSAPTRFPGVTLEPGKYVFRLGTPVSRHNVVEVYSADGTRKIATFLTVDYPNPPVTNTTVMFENVNPPAVRAWYFPGDTVGREFVYAQDEAGTLYASTRTPVLWATWNPDDRTGLGHVQVQTVGQAIGQAARAVGSAAKDVARGVADVTEDIWDDITDNASLANPTPRRVNAERHLDAAEKAFDDLEDRASDDVERRLLPVKNSLEALEDAFEQDRPWMSHYTAVMASIDALAPEKPVGTSGRSGRIDASTHSALMNIRGHLHAFHAQAMVK